MPTWARRARRCCPAATACRAARTGSSVCSPCIRSPPRTTRQPAAKCRSSLRQVRRTSFPSRPCGTASGSSSRPARAPRRSLHAKRLHKVWSNRTDGTSPVVAGSLLYVAAQAPCTCTNRQPVDWSRRSRPDRCTGRARSSPTGGWRSPKVTRTTTLRAACSTSSGCPNDG